MSGQIKVNMDQVGNIANNIHNLNKKLSDQLTSSQAIIKNLSNSWEGEASQSTISSFNEFAANHFQNYYDIVDNYVKFLRNNVESDYIKTETANTTLADAFK